MNIDLKKLRHLSALARHRSFSRAAAELSLTQPALSRSIANLESELGERLFDRTKEGVVATAFGVPIIQQAIELLAESDRFIRAVRARTSADAGQLSFGAGPVVAALCYSGVLAQLANNHPRLIVKAAIAPGKALIEALRSGRIEFAVFAAPLLTDRRDLAVEQVGMVEIGFAVRNGHVLAGRKALDFAELQDFPIASGGERGIDAAWASTNQRDFPPTIQCDDFSILRDATKNSDSIYLTAVSLALADPELTVLDVRNGPVDKVSLVLVHEAGRSLSPPARNACEAIRTFIARA